MESVTTKRVRVTCELEGEVPADFEERDIGQYVELPPGVVTIVGVEVVS